MTGRPSQVPLGAHKSFVVGARLVRKRIGPPRPAHLALMTLPNLPLTRRRTAAGSKRTLRQTKAGDDMSATTVSAGLRRATGALFIGGAVLFAVVATVLSSTFDWPDILREPASTVLTEFVAGGTALVWTWFATAWTYAILMVPILLLPAALDRRDDVVLRTATFVGAISVLLSLIGFLRWVFVVPALAESYVDGPPVTRAAVEAAWLAQHQFGGAVLGEHLGQLFAIGWSVTVSVVVLRTRVLPRWLGVSGVLVSGLYLLNQGDILATAIPGFPVWDLAGLLGSTAWGLWVAALGVTILQRSVPAAASSANTERSTPKTAGCSCLLLKRAPADQRHQTRR